MIVQILGNITVNGEDYEDRGYYEVSDDFARANKQNLRPFSQMTEDERIAAKKATLKKPFKTRWIERISKNKMIKTGDSSTKGAADPGPAPAAAPADPQATGNIPGKRGRKPK